MGGYYCCIDGVPNEVLEFLGYSLIRESDDFELWQDYNGNEQIVYKRGRRYLYVDDFNDAQILRSRRVIPAPAKPPLLPP